MDDSEFRRSSNIEDRRRQKLQWTPGPFGGTPQGEPNVFDSGNLTGLNARDFPTVQPSSAGNALGVDILERTLLAKQQDAEVRNARDGAPVGIPGDNDPNGPPVRIDHRPGRADGSPLANPVPLVLTPVDHDPFPGRIVLTPVDHDPFADTGHFRYADHLLR